MPWHFFYYLYCAFAYGCGTLKFQLERYDGRGQIGRKWEGEAGKNIAVSVILYPRFLEASFQFSLNIVVSLAVRDIIRDLIPEEMEVSVKWPNDIYVGKFGKDIYCSLLQQGCLIYESIWNILYIYPTYH